MMPGRDCFKRGLTEPALALLETALSWDRKEAVPAGRTA